MKLLISGATGFVGVNLCKALEDKFDIVTLGRSREVADYQWDTLGDIPISGIDVYIHLAGKAHDTHNTADADAYFQINTELTKQIYQLFIKSEASLFIAFSSVKAVADTVDGVLEEDHEALPKTPYGQSKLKAEQYIFSQEYKSHQRIIVLRPCMIHGPGNKGNLNLLYQFVKKGIPYPLAAFENRRSFLSIANLIFVIKQMLNDKSIASGVYNIADDESLSTNELVMLIGEGIGRKVHLWSTPIPLIQVLAKIGDILYLPINSERVKKLTESYIVSNHKLKKMLKVSQMPITAQEGLSQTIHSLQ